VSFKGFESAYKLFAVSQKNKKDKTTAVILAGID
jgi:hypothetical protein